MSDLSRVFRGLLSGAVKGHFGQWAEDVLVRKLFPKAKRTGFYMDLGAYHPFVHSNTAFFWMKGWHGINVDANPHSIALFKKARPKDTNVWAALLPHTDIQKGTREVELHLPDQFDTQSSVSATGTVKLEMGLDRGFSKSIRVPSMSVLDLVNEHAIQQVDYLNIDIEGLDIDILRDLDLSRVRPRVVTIEDFSIDLKELVHSELSVLMNEAGYALVGRAGLTSIFVHE